jgi:Tfp pilus assembly protein PilN
MRAVNLLPEKHRPRRPSGGKSGSSYILLGVLGLVVGAVLMYVVTLNSINSAKTDIAEAEAAAAQANAQADQLGAYGDFANVKAERVASVKQLAQSRMDWERLVRELAHVLPEGVWIQNAAASDAGTPEAGAATSTSGDEAAATAAGQPTLTLTGCASTQAQVADALVRLRQLQGATDVKLDHSTLPETTGSTDTGSASGNCTVNESVTNYEFEVSVTFEAPATDTNDTGNVPARLGGGE